ncbi:tetratricopeptide repeat protein [Ectobacillus ponti]|uniref:Tetratricopeptide repeat protein n=1 Tax=Ectobacillus ponti TaxID=2961894 RepID=A0AA41X7U2_9BACI|nr:tetratricopeptide repeat protein [Ectobacillus ponti]MCP8968763.1 tetratricopeptide repeat protein [Ectobacillus ponti]
MNQLEQAVQYIEQGEVEKGLELLEEREQAGTDEEKYYVAYYYQRLGLVERALRIMEDLHTLYPDEIEFRLLLAELYVDDDREDEAIDLLSEVAEDEEGYVRTLLLLADLYQMQGLEEVAEKKLLQAQRLLPDEPIVSFGLAELYSSRGDDAKAVPYYKALLDEHDEMGGVNLSLRLAECLSALGSWEEAIPYYEAGLQEQENLHSVFGYGFTLYQAQQYQRAIPVFQKVLEQDEMSAAYVYLAECYDQEGMKQESYATWKLALEQDKMSADLHVRFAEAAAKAGETAEAQQALQEALALDPSHLEALLQYIHLLKEDADYERVVELVGYAAEHGEADPQLIWELAHAKRELEQYSEALKHYEDAYTSFKTDAVFLEEYGRFLLEEGLRAQAREVFTQLLQLDPTQTHIEELLYNLEDFG